MREKPLVCVFRDVEKSCVNGATPRVDQYAIGGHLTRACARGCSYLGTRSVGQAASYASHVMSAQAPRPSSSTSRGAPRGHGRCPPTSRPSTLRSSGRYPTARQIRARIVTSDRSLPLLMWHLNAHPVHPTLTTSHPPSLAPAYLPTPSLAPLLPRRRRFRVSLCLL